MPGSGNRWRDLEQELHGEREPAVKTAGKARKPPSRKTAPTGPLPVMAPGGRDAWKAAIAANKAERRRNVLRPRRRYSRTQPGYRPGGNRRMPGGSS